MVNFPIDGIRKACCQVHGAEAWADETKIPRKAGGEKSLVGRVIVHRVVIGVIFLEEKISLATSFPFIPHQSLQIF